MTIEDRVARLERENRGWRRITLALAVVVMLALACSHSDQAGRSQASGEASSDGLGDIQADSIRTKSLMIGDGITAANIFLDGSGITVFSKDLKQSVTILAENSGARLQIRSARDGKLYSPVAFGKAETGGGWLSIENPFGSEVVSVESNKSNIGAVYLKDVNGETKRAFGGE